MADVDLLLTFFGLAVGSIVGLVGVGGGALMTPLLIIYGINPVIAVGTDLVYALFGKSMGAWLHHAQESVNWRVVGLLSLGSIPASLICVALLRLLDTQGWEYQRLIQMVVGVVLVLVALSIFVPKRLASGDPEKAWSKWSGYLTILTGVSLGILVTLTSIGAGAVGAAALMLLYPRLPAVTVVGTDLAHAVPLLAIAAMGHWRLGNVDYGLLISLLPGVLPGVWAGTKLGSRLPEALLRKGLAIVLLCLGGLMVAKR